MVPQELRKIDDLIRTCHISSRFEMNFLQSLFVLSPFEKQFKDESALIFGCESKGVKFKVLAISEFFSYTVTHFFYQNLFV
jgi:hypothetical protein